MRSRRQPDDLGGVILLAEPSVSGQISYTAIRTHLSSAGDANTRTLVRS